MEREGTVRSQSVHDETLKSAFIYCADSYMITGYFTGKTKSLATFTQVSIPSTPTIRAVAS